MPAFGPPASLLRVLLCVSAALHRCHPHRCDLHRCDLQLAYVTPTHFVRYSCSQEPPPCSTAALSDCRCRDVPLAAPPPPPAFRTKRLTVWFTSPSDAARLLNNSEVTHLTLIHCGPAGARGTPSSTPGRHFAVHRLERLTVIHLPHAPPPPPPPEAHRGRNAESNVDPETDNGVYLDTNRFNRDTNLDWIVEPRKDAPSRPPSRRQDMFLGRESGAAYHEQARLGVIHRSVLEWGAEVKAYTVQTHIDSDGVLPFPDLHLPKLQKTSVIYVSFVY